MKTDYDRIEVAASSIGRGFDWRSTPDGETYWHEVYKKLMVMVESRSLDGKKGVPSFTTVDIGDADIIRLNGEIFYRGIKRITNPYSY